MSADYYRIVNGADLEIDYRKAPLGVVLGKHGSVVVCPTCGKHGERRSGDKTTRYVHLTHSISVRWGERDEVIDVACVVRT